jgi:hypothetical protein
VLTVFSDAGNFLSSMRPIAIAARQGTAPVAKTVQVLPWRWIGCRPGKVNVHFRYGPCLIWPQIVVCAAGAAVAATARQAAIPATAATATVLRIGSSF